ncbi:MAG: c-type cytochrome [Bacteroidetes bacterium]|nr:c-type cytochrome [Bacteroidota bacterium]
MLRNRKTITILALLIFTAAGNIATKPPGDEKESYKNLKVLAKDISEDDMERIMYRINKDLGVTCLHCHIPGKDTTELRVDFASDEKKEKRVARDMLKMTMKLNKKYFNTIIDKKITVQPTIWCRTCHRGFPRPNRR